jgi:hypothetical protein
LREGGSPHLHVLTTRCSLIPTLALSQDRNER